MKSKLYDAKLHNKNKPKWENVSGKADRRMSQVSQPSLFTNVLPMNPIVPRSHPVSHVGKILIYVNTDYHKLHYFFYQIYLPWSMKNCATSVPQVFDTS